jgi:capsid protein
MDDDFLRGGVEHNAARVPVRYWIRERHPLDLGLSTFNLKWNPWERFATPLGRPQVLHGFDPDRAEQTRGVTRFAAALKSFRSLARFSDATLQSATINALVLGYIQSSRPEGGLRELQRRRPGQVRGRPRGLLRQEPDPWARRSCRPCRWATN